MLEADELDLASLAAGCRFLAGMAATTSPLSSSDCIPSVGIAATGWGVLHCHRRSANWASSFRWVSSVPARCAWIVGSSLMVKAALEKAVPSSPGGQYSRREASTSNGPWLLLAVTCRHLVAFYTGVS